MSLTDTYNVKNFKLFYVMSELMRNGVTVSVLGTQALRFNLLYLLYLKV